MRASRSCLTAYVAASPHLSIDVLPVTNDDQDWNLFDATHRGHEQQMVPVGQKWGDALIMGAIAYDGLHLANTHRVIGYHAPWALLLVAIGAGVYVSILFAIPEEFRAIVTNILVFDVPLIPP